MSETVTVSGGDSHSPAVLRFTANDQAFMQAKAFASVIGDTYKSAVYYDPNEQPVSPGYLIVSTDFVQNVIDARGFGAVVIENNVQSSAIIGGGSATGQTVLAGSAGLMYTAYTGSNTVIAGGGNNSISFSGSTGDNVATTSTGNDTITAGKGNTTISAGTGRNFEYLQTGGKAVVNVTGQDTVTLAATGSDTINVSEGGSALVLGPSKGAGASLVFIGGNLASTVQGGVGSYTVMGGMGGGLFNGGANGNNSIVGGTGAVTINGGGAGDTLQGGAGDDSINASFGNETLGGGAGHNTFDLTIHAHAGNAGDNMTDTVTDFSTLDLLNVGGATAIQQALNTYQISGGNASFLLQDGTKVILTGYTQSLNQSSFVKS